MAINDSGFVLHDTAVFADYSRPKNFKISCTDPREKTPGLWTKLLAFNLSDDIHDQILSKRFETFCDVRYVRIGKDKHQRNVGYITVLTECVPTIFRYFLTVPFYGQKFELAIVESDIRPAPMSGNPALGFNNFSGNFDGPQPKYNSKNMTPVYEFQNSNYTWNPRESTQRIKRESGEFGNAFGHGNGQRYQSRDKNQLFFEHGQAKLSVFRCKCTQEELSELFSKYTKVYEIFQVGQTKKCSDGESTYFIKVEESKQDEVLQTLNNYSFKGSKLRVEYHKPNNFRKQINRYNQVNSTGIWVKMVIFDLTTKADEKSVEERFNTFSQVGEVIITVVNGTRTCFIYVLEESVGCILDYFTEKKANFFGESLNIMVSKKQDDGPKNQELLGPPPMPRSYGKPSWLMNNPLINNTPEMRVMPPPNWENQQAQAAFMTGYMMAMGQQSANSAMHVPDKKPKWL